MNSWLGTVHLTHSIYFIHLVQDNRACMKQFLKIQKDEFSSPLVFSHVYRMKILCPFLKTLLVHCAEDLGR